VGGGEKGDGRHLLTPQAGGDNWSDPLEAEDKRKICAYFGAREALHDNFGFVQMTAGGSTRHRRPEPGPAPPLHEFRSSARLVHGQH